MSFSLQYRRLLGVEIRHDYYLSADPAVYQGDAALQQMTLDEQTRSYDVSRLMALTPTPETTALMRDYRMVFRPNRWGYEVAMQVQALSGIWAGSYAPFLTLDQPLRLRMTLRPHTSYFSNFTNLPFHSMGGERAIYHFTNRAANPVGAAPDTQLYLSQPMAGFDPQARYAAGSLLREGNALLEALVDNGPAPARLPAEWREIYLGQTPHFQFVTEADRVPLRPSRFQHPVNTGGLAFETLDLEVIDHLGQVLHRVRATSEGPGISLTQVPLNLDTLLPGRYQLVVRETNGTPVPALGLSFYLDDQLYLNPPLGLIELFHAPDGSLGTYAWAASASPFALQQPTYQLRWKNRATWWRYYYPAAPDLTAASSDVDYLDGNPAAPNHRILITNAPQGLTQQYQRVVLANAQGDIHLPNPGVSAVFPTPVDGRVYSEINMGGGLGPPR
jgi:hypothetical protein